MVEYLLQIQRGSEWARLTRNAEIENLVILRDGTLPLVQWSLVRVTRIPLRANGTDE